MFVLGFSFLLMNAMVRDTSFLERQLSFSRVDAAMDRHIERIEDQCAKVGSDKFDEIYLRAFKQEKLLEVWKLVGSQYVLYDTFPICQASGELGPKKKQGDRQVPEGFYEINVFNPASNFLLSLGLNYPNKRDAIVNKPPRGGDIYIHGKCMSIGCLAMEDLPIEEIYCVALLAKAAGQQQIPVHIFPFKMNTENMSQYSLHEKGEVKHFWETLQPMYENFEEEKKISTFFVTEDGKYMVAKP